MGKEIYSDRRELVRELLKRARLDAGLSQVDVGNRLKRHQSFVSDYERGPRKLDWVDVADILEACGADIVQFAKAFKDQSK